MLKWGRAVGGVEEGRGGSGWRKVLKRSGKAGGGGGMMKGCVPGLGIKVAAMKCRRCGGKMGFANGKIGDE